MTAALPARSPVSIFSGRDPNQGLLGIYGDWAYTNPEHGGRVGVEASVYHGRYTLDVLAGIQFGQHLYTKFVDEVDLGYYFTDNFRASIGHRLTSRGHVGNVSFEYMFENASVDGISVFGEVEAGQDNYVGAWGGIRYSFGTGSWTTLIDRDRRGDPIVRVPREIWLVCPSVVISMYRNPRPSGGLRLRQPVRVRR